MDLVTKQGFCYIWNQTLAKRGANEISSCLYAYANENLKDSETEEVSFFSDNCPGQNKNRMINQMLSVLTINLNNLKAAELIFLEKGHTQNCNDSVHSSIEKAKKGINVYHPFQWETLVQTACKSTPYLVKSMSQEDFYEFSSTLNGSCKLMFQKKAKEFKWCERKCVME